MIPYVEIHTIPLGPVTIQVWGLLVALGILAGAKASEWMLRRRALDAKVIWEILPWIIAGGIVGARLFHFVYEPASYIEDPLSIVAIWNGGMSITGGLIGAALVGLWRLHRRKLNLFSYTDAIMFGLPLGMFVGRIGCFLTNMHPGTPTSFFLGMQQADGLVRHNLGLYLSFDGLLLFLLFLWMAWHKARTGAYLTVYLLWYGVVRFALDFLRAYDGPIVDTRYFSLTPAQYGALAMIVLGIILLRRTWYNKHASHG